MALGGASSTGGQPSLGPQPPVKLGITYPDVGGLAVAFGGQNQDGRAPLERFVTYMNAHGGIAGRKIVPTYYKANAAGDQNTEAQAACAALSQDTRVDAVINTGVMGTLLAACLQKKGIPVVDSAFVFPADGQDARQYPNLFYPDAMRIDRAVSALLSVSTQLGRLKRGDRLGVIVEDCPWGERIFKNVVTPLAQRAGVTVTEATHKCVTNLLGDAGPVAASIQQAELRFASPPSATHVMAVSEAEAFVIAQFTGYASQQRYYPKYLITSIAYGFQDSQPDAVIKMSQDALPNMSGAGWLPLLDVGNLATPNGQDQGAAQARCTAADPAQGLTKSTNGNGRYFQLNGFYNICDAFFTVKAVLEENGVRADSSDFARGYLDVLSGRRASAALASGYFRVSAGRTDGAGQVRPFAFNSSRQAFVYTGKAIEVA